MKKRNIPTKAELLRLQKLYKTDEKIGERLGGVPAYLVAYWRRKKNIPKYSLPKFSEAEIQKSAGPGTAIVVSISKNALNQLSRLTNKPIHVIGSFCS